MDPAHGTTQDDEYFLQGIIRENEDIDVTRTFLVTFHVCNKATLHHKHHLDFTLKFLHLNMKWKS
jgi:hypothetical protein